MNRDATATWIAGTRTGPCDGLPGAPCGQIGALTRHGRRFLCDGCAAELDAPAPARDAPAAAERLFDFPTTMRGQTALDTDGGAP